MKIMALYLLHTEHVYAKYVLYKYLVLLFLQRVWFIHNLIKYLE